MIVNDNWRMMDRFAEKPFRCTHCHRVIGLNVDGTCGSPKCSKELGGEGK